jgi:ribosomal protein S18 acetylase RimI-like enzyme
MDSSVTIKTGHLQGELITSDIRFSGKAYLRGIACRDDLQPGPLAFSYLQETRELLAEAARIAAAKHGQELMAGFRLGQPNFPAPLPNDPPAGFIFYTEFITLAAPAALLGQAAGSPASPPAISRVPLQAGQIDLLIQIRAESMRGVPNLPALTREEVQEQTLPSPYHLIYIESGDANDDHSRQAAGFYNLAVDAGQHRAELEELGVLPAFRGLGIGRKVITQVAMDLALQGIDTMELLVATSNEGALRLYDRLGFKEESRYSRWFRRSLA